MKYTISFRNLEHTPSLDEMIKQKSEKLKKFLTASAELEWVCWVEDNDQVAELKVHDKKDNFIAKAKSEDLYKTMDLVINKMSNQISHKH
ncbi:ribosome-associated translation inhibitor RaiA [Halobacteriovorax sp. GB3]|uniref:ribosome hibernation-promoting factor, HPF/YfiA family n=1 Tax=Halobacteriovorax sp. GB3 TaxID=2719615 RepID=UPI0023601605|nr:ribosome-associated translation inhibitor RaiA [Halobacteriovorax sp. GB3]MDD0853428.1 ribosome-associated translation inhibitor RaiA [Halobacteriovorax sp. GB3]